MSADEYWDAPPRLAKAYREAYKQKMRVKNYDAWLSGLYVYSAVGAVVGAAFTERGHKAPQYLTEPLDIEKETREPTKAEIQIERDNLIDRLSQFKAEWDRRNGTVKQ